MNHNHLKETFGKLNAHDLPAGVAALIGIVMLFLVFRTGKFFMKLVFFHIAVGRLAQEPAGKVYTSPHIGTLIPAYTPHRVYLGHWFLTPDYPAKLAYFNDLMEGRASPRGLADLIQKEAIDYVLLPPAMPRSVLDAIRPLAKNIIAVDQFVLVLTH